MRSAGHESACDSRAHRREMRRCEVRGGHVSSLLLVEDDERVRRFVVRGLESEGHAVSTAGDGPRGLAAARNGQFDALILDMMLPQISGKDICQRLRAMGVNTPILMLTALD